MNLAKRIFFQKIILILVLLLYCYSFCTHSNSFFCLFSFFWKTNCSLALCWHNPLLAVGGNLIENCWLLLSVEIISSLFLLFFVVLELFEISSSSSVLSFSSFLFVSTSTVVAENTLGSDAADFCATQCWAAEIEKLFN